MTTTIGEKETGSRDVQPALKYLVRVAFALALISAVLGALFSKGGTVLVTVLAIMAGLLVLFEALPRVMEFAIGPFSAKLDKVEDRQNRQETEIKAIQIALKGILADHERWLLKGVNMEERFLIRYEPDLYGYLHRLDGLKFIQPNPGFGLVTIEQRHKADEALPFDDRPQFDLKEFVYVTDDGKNYLSILARVEK
jgi:uncharacterized membrane protein